MARKYTPEERATQQERIRQYKHDWHMKRRAAMSPEELVAKRKVQNERSRVYLSGLDPKLKSERAKASRLRHVAQRKADCREWRKRNAEKVAEYNREWRSGNTEVVARLHREYKARHKAERNAQLQARYRADLRYRLEVLLRNRTGTALRRRRLRGARVLKVADLIGCSIDELIAYIAKVFKPGMSWENHGEWHIDHIVPCAAFDLRDPDQQRTCFHYSNLQPLWAKDNLTKQAKGLGVDWRLPQKRNGNLTVFSGTITAGRPAGETHAPPHSTSGHP